MLAASVTSRATGSTSRPAWASSRAAASPFTGSRAPQKNPHSGFRQLAADLEPDPAVCARHKGD